MVLVYSTVRMYASLWCRGTELDADDLVQEVFVAYFRQYSDGTAVCGNLTGWLCRAVRNRAISLLRSAKRRRKRERVYVYEMSPWFEMPTLDTDPTQQMTAMLQSLKAEWRVVVVLRLWGGQTFDEIAESLHQSRTTVYRQYQAALRSLREQYDEFIS
ncbi:MAG: sigma-70 family RNA polymerase sigma factor [Thermoguttaceae bacterium]|nr:sigma-70 family RNA polymerase sigma factor [Thermoguttaceae bacterium]